MSRYSVGRVVSAALDPVLVPAGFAAGQYGDHVEDDEDRPTGSQVIFCAAHDEISDRHPWLPQADNQERGVGACVDGQAVDDALPIVASALQRLFEPPPCLEGPW